MEAVHMIRSQWTESAAAFIFLMGMVSLFADMTHEGARSIFGVYLNLLGASAGIIGFVTGLGELLGYSLRFVTGVIADKTRQYWLMTVFGYVINVLAIPCLALVPDQGWIWASVFIVLERMGKAVRQPAKNTLLSFAASKNGMGKGFAVQEFMDQIGAFLGPVIIFAVLSLQKGEATAAAYSRCFAILFIPALACIFCVLSAKRKFPHPDQFEIKSSVNGTFYFRKSFVCYMGAIGLLAFGFIDFPLITMHAARTGLVAGDTLPLLYAAAMLADAFSASFAFFAFSGDSSDMLWLGVVLWGIGMGAQESVLRSAVSSMVPTAFRSTGFGIFETGFGIAWFAGSWLLGILYSQSVNLMIFISCLTQLLAVPLFLWTCQRMKTEQKEIETEGV